MVGVYICAVLLFYVFSFEGLIVTVLSVWRVPLLFGFIGLWVECVVEVLPGVIFYYNLDVRCLWCGVSSGKYQLLLMVAQESVFVGSSCDEPCYLVFWL